MNWNTLLVKAKEGECVPFIGAGACLPVLPLAAKLSETLIEEDERAMNNRCSLSTRTDLATTAQYLAVTHHDGRYPKLKIRGNIIGIPWPDDRRRMIRTVRSLN